MHLPTLKPLPARYHPYFSWVADERLAYILHALRQGGGVCCFVGGCVRDGLLGERKTPLVDGDIDVATTLVPTRVMEIAMAAGIKVRATGIKHGTVTLVWRGCVVEVTTLRGDIACDGRHAEVEFGKSWQVDASRRDFTINALYLTPDMKFFDVVGAMHDIEKKRVRFIGEPTARIKEDYLRILRFFRFSGRFASCLDADGLRACVAARGGLRHISKERIGQEFSKILSTKTAPEILMEMIRGRILPLIFDHDPSLLQFKVAHAGAAIMSYSDRSEVMRQTDYLSTSLWPDMSPRSYVTALRFPRAMGVRISRIQSFLQTVHKPATLTDLKISLYHYGADIYRKGLCLALGRAQAMSSGPVLAEGVEVEHALCLPKNWSVPKFPITAHDFMQHGLMPGPELGQALAQAERLWIAQNFPKNHNALEVIVQCTLQK